MQLPLYLRDLTETARLSTEKTIRNKRPELVEALEKGDDIQIGAYYDPAHYEEV